MPAIGTKPAIIEGDVALRLGKKERQRRILQELQVHPHVRVATLAERFDVATETIRRDLDALLRGVESTRERATEGSDPFARCRGATATEAHDRVGGGAFAPTPRDSLRHVHHLTKVHREHTHVCSGGRLLKLPGENNDTEPE